MFSRKNEEMTPTLLDAMGTEVIRLLFADTYKNECKKLRKTFFAHIEIYPDEILYILSLIDPKDESIIPLSLFFSIDKSDKTELAPILEKLNESASIFFDQYFAVSEDEAIEFYQHDWSEGEFGNNTLFYRVSRENIKLTLEAEKLLKN